MSAWSSDDTDLLDSVRNFCDRASLGLVSIEWLSEFRTPSPNIFVGDMGGRHFRACFMRPLLTSERNLLRQLCHERDAIYTERLAFLEMVHELGNPLSVLDGHLQFIRAGLESEARWRSVFRAITQMTQRLHQENHCRIVWPFNILEVIDEVIEDLSATADTKSIIWNRPTSTMFLTWQRERAQQILFNLLKNAVEAGESHGVIDITIFRDNDECTMAVKNRGQHIPDAVADTLFLPGRSSKSHGHLGMGLAVSRKLAESLGAKLEYTDALGFVLRVPSCDVMPQTSAPALIDCPPIVTPQ